MQGMWRLHGGRRGAKRMDSETQWFVVVWQRPIMSAPAFWYFETPEEAVDAVEQLGSAVVDVRLVGLEERRAEQLRG